MGARIPITPFIPLFAIDILLLLTVFEHFFFQYCRLGYIPPACLASAHDSFPREHGVGIGVFIIILPISVPGPFEFSGPLSVHYLDPFSVYIYGQEFDLFLDFPDSVVKLACI